MSPAIAYSASRDDLYRPCEHAQFFSSGQPRSEAALCAEFSRLAYCQISSSFAFDQDKIREVLKTVRFTECEFVETSSTHCFVARRLNELAVVAFRGTDADDPTDLGDDGDLILVPWQKGGKVHQGFSNSLKEVHDRIEGLLQPIQGRLLFTGHSLGAALATLLASERNPNFLYTFGSPRVGDAEFAATLKSVSNGRYIDCCDVVTRMPPELFGYVHVGDPFYIGFDRCVKFNPDTRSVEADQKLAREKYLDEFAWKNGTVALRDLADHAPVNYVFPVSADQS